MAQLIDGKKIASEIEEEIKKQVALLEKKPTLKIFLVGSDPASLIYVKKKQEFCQRTGIEAEIENLEEGTSQSELLEKINLANADEKITAVLVQLPLPQAMQEDKILLAIDPQKDPDCLHPENFGLFCQFGQKGARVLPATALAVMKILEKIEVDLSSQEVVVVGNSNIVGKPLSMMLSAAGATVTLCQKKTKDLSSHIRRADIVITATGVKGLIQGTMLKKGAVVIDIGISREGKKIFGDVDFVSAEPVVSWITPVPGGVGPITVAVLAENILKLNELNWKIFE